MHVSDGRCTQRSAAVLTTAAVTTRLDGGAVLDEETSGAMIPASPQLRVECVESVRVQPIDLNLAQER